MESRFIAGGSGFAYPPFLSVLRHCISHSQPQPTAPPASPSASDTDSASTSTSFLVHHAMAVADPHCRPPPLDSSSSSSYTGARSIQATAGDRSAHHVPGACAPNEVGFNPPTSPPLFAQGGGSGCSHPAPHPTPTSQHAGRQKVIPEGQSRRRGMRGGGRVAH